MAILLVILLVLLGLYLLSLRGRKGHPGMEAIRGHAYAHRGLHGNGVPENSMAAFRAALEQGYGIELDVHLCRDGSLAVMHDSLLRRTTGLDGKICDLTREEWAAIRLEGTEETVPSFSQVLELFRGRQPMIIELKADGNNQAALCEAVCKALEGYEGVYCLESFDPRCVWWLRKHRPDLIRGQLSENFFRSDLRTPWIIRFLMSTLIVNALGRPDFVAYRFEHRNHPAMKLCRRLWGVAGVNWTIRSQADFDTAVAEGYVPIFEGFRP